MECPFPSSESIASSAIHNGFHYRVLDIKWMQLKLKIDGQTPLSHPLLPVYRAQLGIYNYLLGRIQGYTAPHTYILGKGTTINTKGKCISSSNSWERVGVLTYDNKFINEMLDAIRWNRSVRTFGKNWDIKPFDTIPNIKNLYPNMCNKYDAPYSMRKRQLAQQLGEITQVWNVGITQRRYAHSQGIYSWHNAQCNSTSLGITSAKIGNLIDKILDVNRNPTCFNNENLFFSEEMASRTNRKRKRCNSSSENTTTNSSKRAKIIYKKMKIPLRDSNSFYLDFETVQTCFFDNENSNSNLVFMIGLGEINHDANIDSNWKFQNWHITSNDKQAELDMVLKMLSYICQSRHPVVYHWSPAEITILRSINNRNADILQPYLDQIRFIDLYKIFLDHQIVIPGAFSFGLKDVATAMFSRGLIFTKWDTNAGGVASGIEAMFAGAALFDTSNQIPILKDKKEILADIAKYNEIDCKVLWEIHIWLVRTYPKVL
jgi:hypothetical protein